MFGGEIWATLFFMTAFCAWLQRDECNGLKACNNDLHDTRREQEKEIQKLKDEIVKYKSSNKELKEQYDAMQTDLQNKLKDFNRENKALSDKISEYNGQNNINKKKLSDLEFDYNEALANIAKLRQENSVLQDDCNQFLKEIDCLKQDNQELKSDFYQVKNELDWLNMENEWYNNKNPKQIHLQFEYDVKSLENEYRNEIRRLQAKVGELQNLLNNTNKQENHQSLENNQKSDFSQLQELLASSDDDITDWIKTLPQERQDEIMEWVESGDDDMLNEVLDEYYCYLDSDEYYDDECD